MKDKITVVDRNELFNKYRNDNLFIEAGAGAGKTQFISDKTIDLLIQGVSIDKIILITFTNKAAEEMLNRISNNIIERLAKESNPEIIKLLTSAKENLFRLNVSTIHSFCNKLLNENSFLAKIPFNFTLIDESEETIRINEYFSKWLTTLKDDEFKELNKLAFSYNNLNETKKMYVKLCNYFPDQDINISTPTDEEYYEFINSIDSVFNILISYQSNLGSYFNKQMNEFINEYSEFLNDIDTYSFDDIPNYLSNNILVKKLKLVINKYKNQFKVKKIDSSSLNKNKDELMDELSKFDKFKTKEFIKRMDSYQYRYINIYAKKAFDYYSTNCSKDKLSNNQLIYYAYKLLVDSVTSKVKDKLANKYETIFVDEFQDTDKYQIKFIDTLVKAIIERKKKEGVNTTSLVVVGDPKQSIYRFRGADIDSFIAYQIDDSYNKVNIFFPDNFRSNNFIISYLNDTFSAGDKSFHDSYKYEAMLVSKKNTIDKVIKGSKDILAGVYSFDFKCEDLDKKDKFTRLVKLVKYIVDNKIKIYKSISRSESKFVEVNYGDFLILTHSKAELNEYVKAFNEENIKTLVAGEFDLFSCELFNLVYSIISYLLDKSDNNKIELKKRFEASIDNLSNYEDEFNNYIDELDKSVINKSPYATLMYVFTSLPKQRFFIKNFTNTDNELYNTIIHQILEYANINFNLDSIHLLNELNKLKEDVPEYQLSINKSSNRVRIMNMHKSKGLEGNIVLIPDSGGSATDKTSCLIKNTYYLTINNFDETLKNKGKNEVLQERIRLEYVAASRAQSVLIFDKDYDTHSSIFPKEFYNFEDNHLEQYHLNNTSLPTSEDIDEFYKDINKESFDKYYAISSSKDFKLNNLDVIIKDNINSFSPSSKENHEDILPASTININRPKNNIFGDALHRSMELLINDYSKDISLIVKQVIKEKELDILEDDKPNFNKYLIDMVGAIKSIYDKDSSFKDYQKYPEYKFTCYIEKDKSLINGSIDLLLINKDYIKIIDYKSDIAGFNDVSSFEDILKKRYIEQLKLYKEVIKIKYPKALIDLSIIWVEEKEDKQIAHEIKIKEK